MLRLLRCCAAALLALSVLASTRLHAEDAYPTRPIRLVVPSVPGGVHDVIGRLWAEQVKPLLGTIVVDNRGGAGGMIGTTDVANAHPDGYSTLIGSTTTQVLQAASAAKLPYDPLKDFAAVAIFANSSTSEVINPSVPATNLAELIAYAKANPGKLSYGSAGNGSITNLSGEMFKQKAGGAGSPLDIVHIPYKGVGAGITDLISGQIPMFTPNATAQILDLHRAGKLRILAVNSDTRLRGAPDIPTAIEAGLPDMQALMFFGIFAPASTPRPILEQINAATQKVMQDEEFQKKLVEMGFEPMLDLATDKADDFVRREQARWLPVLKATAKAE